MRRTLSTRAVVLMVTLILALPILGACDSSSTATTKNNGPVWGFPFKTGTTVTLGSYGLHDDNFGADGGYTLNNAKPQDSTDSTHANEASLDLLPAGSAVPVYPLASGKVLAANPACHFVLIDHGNDTWVAYLHINVNVKKDDPVARDKPLGTTAAPPPTPAPCGEQSDAEHLHFAFLTGQGIIGSYISMVGRVLCGYQVIKNGQYPNGALQELANTKQVVAPKGQFTVQDCPTSSQAILGASTAAPSSCGTAHGTAVMDDFNKFGFGRPSSYLLRGASGAAASVVPSQAGYTLEFPEVDNQYWDSWALRQTPIFCPPFTAIAHFSFQTSGDRAGITIAWNDTTQNRIDIQANVYFSNIEFRITDSNSGQSSPAISGPGLSRFSLNIQPSIDYWLKVVATSTDTGGKVEVYWSISGTNYQLVATATGLGNLSGLVGMGTAGPNMPRADFYSLEATQQ